jgi:hypothetical protein
MPGLSDFTKKYGESVLSGSDFFSVSICIVAAIMVPAAIKRIGRVPSSVRKISRVFMAKKFRRLSKKYFEKQIESRISLQFETNRNGE